MGAHGALWSTELACPEGIEPPTTCLEGRCSIQLSYGQIPGRTEAKTKYRRENLVGAKEFEPSTPGLKTDLIPIKINSLSLLILTDASAFSVVFPSGAETSLEGV